jgi:hypothetical protein
LNAQILKEKFNLLLNFQKQKNSCLVRCKISKALDILSNLIGIVYYAPLIISDLFLMGFDDLSSNIIKLKIGKKLISDYFHDVVSLRGNNFLFPFFLDAQKLFEKNNFIYERFHIFAGTSVIHTPSFIVQMLRLIARSLYSLVTFNFLSTVNIQNYSNTVLESVKYALILLTLICSVHVLYGVQVALNENKICSSNCDSNTVQKHNHFISFNLCVLDMDIGKDASSSSFSSPPFSSSIHSAPLNPYSHSATLLSSHPLLYNRPSSTSNSFTFPPVPFVPSPSPPPLSPSFHSKDFSLALSLCNFSRAVYLPTIVSILTQSLITNLNNFFLQFTMSILETGISTYNKNGVFSSPTRFTKLLNVYPLLDPSYIRFYTGTLLSSCPFGDSQKIIEKLINSILLVLPIYIRVCRCYGDVSNAQSAKDLETSQETIKSIYSIVEDFKNPNLFDRILPYGIFSNVTSATSSPCYSDEEISVLSNLFMALVVIISRLFYPVFSQITVLLRYMMYSGYGLLDRLIESSSIEFLLSNFNFLFSSYSNPIVPNSSLTFSHCGDLYQDSRKTSEIRNVYGKVVKFGEPLIIDRSGSKNGLKFDENNVSNDFIGNVQETKRPRLDSDEICEEKECLFFYPVSTYVGPHPQSKLSTPGIGKYTCDEMLYLQIPSSDHYCMPQLLTNQKNLFNYLQVNRKNMFFYLFSYEESVAQSHVLAQAIVGGILNHWSNKIVSHSLSEALPPGSLDLLSYYISTSFLRDMGCYAGKIVSLYLLGYYPTNISNNCLMFFFFFWSFFLLGLYIYLYVIYYVMKILEIISK